MNVGELLKGVKGRCPSVLGSCTADERGFTLVEVVIAISLLVGMMIPVADAYVSSITATTNAHTREVAAMLADSALDEARAIDATRYGGSKLLFGRASANVSAEWASPAPGLSAATGVLANTSPQYDGDTADSPATLPTSPQTKTVGGQTFHVYYYVGTCYEPSYGSGGQSDAACTLSATGTEMYRVIVDVVWPATHAGCGSSGCDYVASTLISGAADPAFDVNPVIPFITSAASTTFQTGSAGSFQFTSNGFPPPTYRDLSYGNGACTAASLPSGITFNSYGLLSGTPAAGTQGTYTICAQATNASGTGTQLFTFTVVSAFPSGWHRLLVADDSLCLDVWGASTAPGAVIDQYACNGGTNQEFGFVPVSGGYGELQAESSSDDIAVANNSTVSGQPDIIQQAPNGSPSSLWLPQQETDGSWQFQNQNSGLCLDVYGAGNNQGQQLDQWACKNGPGTNQDFNPR